MQVGDGKVEGEGHEGRASSCSGEGKGKPCSESVLDQMWGKGSLEHNPCLLRGPHQLGHKREGVPMTRAFYGYHFLFI